ncbi:MAG: EpsI family protein [Deltaproteobacteria bacterium]|nr:EpsI family protein [Deltaproteobacteria bacterium]
MSHHQNKNLFRLIGVLSFFLIVLVWARYHFLDSDFQIKFKTSFGQKESAYTFTADTSLYQFTSYEGKMPVQANFFSPHFLSYFPLQIGNWVGKDMEHQYADISLFRLYQNTQTQDTIWVIIVYGSHQSQFHSAEVCYLSDGWDVATRDIKKVKSLHHEFPVRYLLARKGENVHMVAYWYLWETPRRKVEEGTLLFRLSVEMNQSEEKAQTALLSFMNSLSNLVMEEKGPKGHVPKPISVVHVPDLPALKGKPQAPAFIKTVSNFKEAKSKAIQWILNQRVPNPIVPFPQMDRRYLLLSYELNAKNPQTQNDKSYNYIYSRSSIYDDALGLIALTMGGYHAEAEGIIEAFERIITDKGDLWFSYNTHNEWPSSWDHSEATIRNGASSWVGYAIAFYVQNRLLENPSLKNNPNIKRWVALSQKIADRLLQDQVLNSKDSRFGFMTGGKGGHDLVWDTAQGKVIEKFKEDKIEWASIEHNLDLYFLLKALAELTTDQKYEGARKVLGDVLLKKAWSEKTGQFHRGMRVNGADEAPALDCASWGLLFLKAMGENSKAQKTLKAMENYFILDPLHQVEGYRPYYKGYVFDEFSINKLFYPHYPQKSWSDIQMVWSEGSLGVAMAYLKMGKKEKAIHILREILKMQTPSGGIRYATQEVPFQFSPSPSMAGTAWLAIVLHALENPQMLDRFWN